MTKKREDWPAIGADLAFVIIFAWIGRNNHDESLGFGDIAWVALPFAAAALIIHLILFYRGSNVRAFSVGIVIWLVTWLIGSALRGLTGAGVAPLFIAVAGAFLALMLLGWRLIYLVYLRIRRRSVTRED